MSEIIFIYVTFPSEVLAAKMANNLINDKLIACANIYPGVKSVYRWEGKNQRTEEAVAIFKTRRENYGAVSEKIMKEHEFKTPCIAVLPVEHMLPQYAEWILKETQK